MVDNGFTRAHSRPRYRRPNRVRCGMLGFFLFWLVGKYLYWEEREKGVIVPIKIVYHEKVEVPPVGNWTPLSTLI